MDWLSFGVGVLVGYLLLEFGWYGRRRRLNRKEEKRMASQPIYCTECKRESPPDATCCIHCNPKKDDEWGILRHIQIDVALDDRGTIHMRQIDTNKPLICSPITYFDERTSEMFGALFGYPPGKLKQLIIEKKWGRVDSET